MESNLDQTQQQSADNIKQQVDQAITDLLQSDLGTQDKINHWQQLYAFITEHRVLITPDMWLLVLDDPVIGQTIPNRDKRREAIQLALGVNKTVQAGYEAAAQEQEGE